ncbi:MAG: hypothetical protein GY858_06000 [Candidatus Omnitrophica bacterium]|nr:hypothetical protein [Candidatus Omnitrophota bacterium]
MICPKKEEITLYYYRELSASKVKFVKNHLKICKKCASEYAAVESFLKGLDLEGVVPEELDYSLIMDKAKEPRFNPILDFVNNLRFGLSFSPRLVPVLAVLILTLAIFPFIGKKESNYNLEILQIEMELSLGSASALDEYFDDEVIEELSNPEYSILQSNQGPAHKET